MAGGACMVGETTIVADGTHPTGMHSWFCLNFFVDFHWYRTGRLCATCILHMLLRLKDPPFRLFIFSI